MSRTHHNPFSAHHPAVALTYLVCAAAFAMAAMQPVYAGLSLAGALVCATCVRGKEALRHAAWLPVLVAVVAGANLLFVGEGSTTLFALGERAFTLEALLYGLCSGVMLAAVFMWMTSYAACMDSAATVALALANIPLAAIACAQYSFYPTPPQLVMWWGYLPYAALMLLPAALSLREWWLWRA